MISSRYKSFSLAVMTFAIFGFLIACTTPISNAHFVKNSISTNLKPSINKDQELVVDLEFYFPSSEVNLVYGIVDTNNDKIISNDEKSEYLNKLKNLISFKTEFNNYTPMSVEFVNTYQDLLTDLYPTWNNRLNLGKVDITKSSSPVSIFNKIKFNSILIQDWNLLVDQGSKIEFKDTSYYPTPNLVQEEIRSNWRSQDAGQAQIYDNTTSNQGFYQSIRSYLKNPDQSFIGLLSILGICLLFGAIHSFQPGHGKAIIGSYLAAINGGLKDSVIMSLSTTISHTFIIVFLGLVWAILKDGIDLLIPFVNFRISLPRELVNISQFANYIQYFAGIALLITGIYMALKYYKLYIDYTLAQKFGSYNEVIIDIDSDKVFTTLNHGDHTHIIPNKKLSLKESIWLGFNTGLSPCFDALILFTFSISLGYGWLGFAMITTFSLGLGIALAIIGLITSKSINKLTRTFSSLESISLILPIISSVVIIIFAILNLIK